MTNSQLYLLYRTKRKINGKELKIDEHSKPENSPRAVNATGVSRI